MAKIRIICIGKLKFKGLLELESEYFKRIKHFININLIQIKAPKFKSDLENIKAEGKLFSNNLKENDYVIACDKQGRAFSSREFSAFLSQQISSLGSKRMVFLIGGFAGLSKYLDPLINQKISFSKMTFAHDIFRTILLEQLYRAFTITKNIKYHR